MTHKSCLFAELQIAYEHFYNCFDPKVGEKAARETAAVLLVGPARSLVLLHIGVYCIIVIL